MVVSSRTGPLPLPKKKDWSAWSPTDFAAGMKPCPHGTLTLLKRQKQMQLFKP